MVNNPATSCGDLPKVLNCYRHRSRSRVAPHNSSPHIAPLWRRLNCCRYHVVRLDSKTMRMTTDHATTFLEASLVVGSMVGTVVLGAILTTVLRR